MPATPEHRAQLVTIIDRCIQSGSVPIAYYGAGRFLADIRPPVWALPGVNTDRRLFLGVIDDDPSRRGGECVGLPVISADDALSAGVRAVIITAEGDQQTRMFDRRRQFLRRGAQVFCCPARFASKPWDDALIDHYEWTLARSRGIDRPYTRTWPAADFRFHPSLERLHRAEIRPGDKVCEIGPGSGLGAERIIDLCGRYYAFDYSGRGMHEALEHRLHAHLDKIECHVDPHASLAGAPDRSVDVVVSAGVFMHIKIDVTHQFLRSIRRVLKPGGRAVIQFVAWDRHAVENLPAFSGLSPGSPNIMEYTHPEWLALSAAEHGLRAEPAGERIGPYFNTRFTPA